jgi:hypothetical protein
VADGAGRLARETPLPGDDTMKTQQPTYTPQPLPNHIPPVADHCNCGAELHHGDCPACDPWPEDDFED